MPEDHPDFIAAWLAEEAAPPTRATPGSLAHEIAAYLASEKHRSLSRDYARVIEAHAHSISLSYGDAPARFLKGEHVRLDIDRLPANKANARLKAWRLICGHIAKRPSAIDASAGIAKKTTPKSDGHLPVTRDQWASYRERWPLETIQRRAGELLYWTGARVSDAVRLSPSHIGHDGLLSFRQSKTANPAYVPWTCALPEWASEWEADRSTLHRALKSADGFTFLETVQGKARTKKGLSNVISHAFREIGVDRSAHGFRKMRLTMIAEAGGSTQAIMSWGGHVTLAEAESYTRTVERRRVVIGVNSRVKSGL